MLDLDMYELRLLKILVERDLQVEGEISECSRQELMQIHDSLITKVNKEFEMRQKGLRKKVKKVSNG